MRDKLVTVYLGGVDMFFIFGISNKEKELDFRQATECPSCGVYGSLEAFMVYNYFSLFFIPIFRWSKRYFIKSTCCGSIYTIEKDLGRAIERGDKPHISPSDLTPLASNYNRGRSCNNCGYPLDPGFEYCPKCGIRQN